MGNGWSNDIPNPFIVGGGGLSGEIDILNASNQLFMFMNSNGFFLVDPVTNQLLAAITPDNEDLPVYGEVFQGIYSYDPLATDVATGLSEGEVKFVLRNQTQNGFFGKVAASNPGAVNIAPALTLTAPATNAAPDQAFVDVGGNSEDGSDVARIILGKTVPGDVPVLVWGTMDYGHIGSTVPEPWHAAAFGANWSNNGGAFGNVAYKRTPLGEVALTGLAKFTGTTAAPSTVFTLPVGYRPNRNINYVSGTQTNPVAPYAIGITTAGLVTVTQYGGVINPGPVSFEGLSFYITGA